ncbi:hypothetical protein WEI85_38875 [Actinomycetes bacterium KLBMP 9797]
MQMTVSAHRALRRFAVVGAGVAALILGAATTASAAVVTANRTVTVSGTTYTLALSAEDTLAAAGQTVAVEGHGYNTGQGVYVGLCVIPDTFDPANPVYGTAPTPCLGGADQTGSTGASHWVSNSILAGTIANSSKWTVENGTGAFAVSIYVNPNISASAICGDTVQCAIVTRADHTASSNRTYDLFLPVTFQ